MTDNSKTYPHYFKQLPAGTTHVDVYLLLDLYKVHNAAVAHAVKKLLCSGQRGSKDQRQDLVEARDSIQRALDIIDGPVDTGTEYTAGEDGARVYMTKLQHADLCKFGLADQFIGREIKLVQLYEQSSPEVRDTLTAHEIKSMSGGCAGDLPDENGSYGPLADKLEAEKSDLEKLRGKSDQEIHDWLFARGITREPYAASVSVVLREDGGLEACASRDNIDIRVKDYRSGKPAPFIKLPRPDVADTGLPDIVPLHPGQDNGSTERMVPRYLGQQEDTAAAIRKKLSEHNGTLFMSRDHYAALSKFCLFRFDDMRSDSGVSLYDRPVVFADTLMDCSPVIRVICNGL